MSAGWQKVNTSLAHCQLHRTSHGMPTTRREPYAHMNGKRLGRANCLGPVPSFVAEPARRNDIARRGGPALRERRQVLGGTLKASGSCQRKAGLSSKLRGVKEPHREVAVEAAAGLGVVGRLSKSANGCAHGAPVSRGAPYHPAWVSEGELERMKIRQPQFTCWVGQQCRQMCL
jgi:hypothetical protein